MEIFAWARKHGIDDDDLAHAVDSALVVVEEDEGKVLYLGPDRSANLLEVVSVVREDGTEIVTTPCECDPSTNHYSVVEGDSDA